jgi:dephospho-CoA kinase
MKLLGLSGTNGAGKDTVAELLAGKHNFLFISVSDLLRDELLSRNMTSERENMRALSAEWRREHGLGVLIDKAVELYEKQGGMEKYDGLVVSSIRNPGEIDRIHELSGELVWIDADPRVRFERMSSRNRHDDPQSFEEFMIQQEAEMTHSGDAATLSMADVRDRADRTFMNDHGDLESLDKAIIEELSHLNG